MKDDYIAVAYYTKGTPYERDAEVLKLSLDALGMRHRIVGINDRGSWQANTSYKPLFMFGMMEDLNCPLLYIDVDAFVLRKPTYNPSFSMVATTFPGGELLSGTVYFNGDEGSKKVIERWCLLTEKYPRTLPDGRPAWDQRILKMAAQQTPSATIIMHAPQEYCFIIGLTQEKFPDITDPYVVHTRGRLRHCPESV